MQCLGSWGLGALILYPCRSALLDVCSVRGDGEGPRSARGPPRSFWGQCGSPVPLGRGDTPEPRKWSRYQLLCIEHLPCTRTPVNPHHARPGVQRGKRMSLLQQNVTLEVTRTEIRTLESAWEWTTWAWSGGLCRGRGGSECAPRGFCPLEAANKAPGG